MSDGNAIELRDVVKRFGEIHAVDHVSLQIRDGEFFSMLGPSGSGKTTVLRMIAGFKTPTSGTVWLDGQDVTRQAPFQRNVNTVFQDYALFPHLDVLGNVEYGLAVKKVPRKERRRRAEFALRRFGLLRASPCNSDCVSRVRLPVPCVTPNCTPCVNEV